MFRFLTIICFWNRYENLRLFFIASRLTGCAVVGSEKNVQGSTGFWKYIYDDFQNSNTI